MLIWVPQKLSECFLIKENLTRHSCEQILSDWLTRRIQLCQFSLNDKNSEFIPVLASTIQALYQIFIGESEEIIYFSCKPLRFHVKACFVFPIDPEFYNSTAKSVRKPSMNIRNFYFIFQPRCVDEFRSESVKVQTPPRASKLAEIIVQFFISPLKALLESSYLEAGYLEDFETLAQLSEYRESRTQILTTECEDLMRLVLGTSTSLWLHVFAPVFQLKAQAVVTSCLHSISTFLKNEGFPKYETWVSYHILYPLKGTLIFS